MRKKRKGHQKKNMFGGRDFDRDQEREGSRELVREPVRDALWEPQREPVREPAVGRQPFEARDRRNDIPQQGSPTCSALANVGGIIEIFSFLFALAFFFALANTSPFSPFLNEYFSLTTTL